MSSREASMETVKRYARYVTSTIWGLVGSAEAVGPIVQGPVSK